MAGQDGDGGKPSSLEWQHVTSTKLLHGHSISCNYCHAKFSGGATRIRDHMCRCAAAPNAVKLLFGTRIVDAKEKATAAKAKRTLNFNTGATGARSPTVSPAKLPISPAATAASTAAVVRELDVAFGWLVYANGLPFDTPRKPEMAEIIRLARKLPPHTRYSPPTRKALAGPMLIRAKDTLTKALEPFQQQFQRSGVSLVTDGYKDINGHHISNYLLVCALGAYFHCSVNSTVGPDTTVRVDAIYTAQRMHRVVTDSLADIVQLLSPSTGAAGRYLFWETYGKSYPDLQFVATRLLAQPASSSAAEQNFSKYGFILSKRRNRLTTSRATMLVFNFSARSSWMLTDILCPGQIRRRHIQRQTAKSAVAATQTTRLRLKQLLMRLIDQLGFCMTQPNSISAKTSPASAIRERCESLCHK
ncbi:hypothetical protein QJQ45_010020 [Haematococcus lacustris]|nr:hypothetical protein QJQ45_010020 [Haematococcus lacustris]